LSRKIALRLSSNGDEGKELGFTGSDESVAKELKHWIMTRGNHGSDEKGATHAFAAASNETLSAPPPGLARPGSESNKCRYLSTIERSQFWKLGD